MSSPRAVGIDLGTTYSAVSYLDDRGRTAMVRGAGGDILTPSVVFFCDEETVVGKEARKYLTLWPDAVAQCAKRDMGLPFYSQPIRGRQLPPEVIQACVLRQLKNDATDALGANFKCVITVPAYFDEVRRRATAQAGEMAGLDVLDIVNEPTAAALSFGEILGYLSPAGEPREALTVLVYDLGGGTFDVTVIELAPGNITTLATDGDVRLGGRDWDEALVNWVAERFRAETGADPRQDKVALGELFLAVEEAKRTLSVRGKTSVPVRHAGQVKDISITVEQFEELTEPSLERTSLTTRQVIAAAGVTWDSIDRILLVGGASRMPMVSRMLEGLSGKKPDHSVHPDEAVARGAAIFAGYLLARSPRDENVDVFAESADFQELKGDDAGAIEPADDDARTGSLGLSSAARLAAEQLDKIYQSAKQPAPVAPKQPVKAPSAAATTAEKAKDKRTVGPARPTASPTFSVTDVNSHSLGIEGLNRKVDRKENVVLIERNTRLPARITHHFVTKEAGQRSIVVQVLEGENRDPRQCSRIGRAVMRDLPENLPRGWPIEVVYEYGTNGRLSVYARLPRTQSKVTVEFEHEEGMPGERVRRWRRVIEGNPGFDTFESMLEDIMEEQEVERTSSLDARSIGKPASIVQPARPVEPDFRTSAVTLSSADAVAAMSQTSGVAGDARYDMQGDIRRGEATAVFRQRNWGITILGHILAAVAGLLIGYYVLAWFTPRGNFLELPLPWMPPVEDVRGDSGVSMRLGGS